MSLQVLNLRCQVKHLKINFQSPSSHALSFKQFAKDFLKFLEDLKKFSKYCLKVVQTFPIIS